MTPPPTTTLSCAPVDTDAAALALVSVIELKWLLAGQGCHLHVERMLHDAAYAREALDQAAQSPHAALRTAARRLRPLLLPGS